MRGVIIITENLKMEELALSPLKPKNNEEIREKRKRQIESSALIIFAKNGYLRTKMSMIANEAKISEGLIYRYYQSKEQLFLSIVEVLMKESSREINSLNQMAGTPLEQIRLLTRKMLEEQSKIGFMLIEQAKKEDEVPKRVTDLIKSYSDQNFINHLIPIFIEGQEQGEFISGDPKKILSWYFYIVNLITNDEYGDLEFGFPSTKMLLRLIRNS